MPATAPNVPDDRPPARAAGGVWAVVPVKSPLDAKSRLAPLLGVEERARLVEHMLADVLGALVASSRLAGVLVVTPDAGIASLAESLGAVVVVETGSGLNSGLNSGLSSGLSSGLNSGLNGAIRQAREHLRARAATAMLVIPGDLPLLDVEAVDRLLESAPAGGPAVVVAPDANRVGTNALLCSPPDLVDPAFGPDSFARHTARARGAGAELAIVTLPELELDLDEPDDVAAILHHAGAGSRDDAAACRTIRLLEQLDVARNLERSRQRVDEP